MSALPAQFYAGWRQAQRAAALREAGSGAPPERLLQAVWAHQRLLRARLVTTDGRAVRVLHPGFWNRGAGPDFQRAMIQLGADSPRAGDVEIDLEPSGWRSHSHESNPAYSNVLLHVVWRGTGRGTPPTLELERVLDSTQDELAQWLGAEGSRATPSAVAGQCSAPLRDLDEPARLALFRQAAQVRLQSKAAALHARARESGWEPALLAGLMSTLGYRHNVWPMLHLAEMAPLLRGAGSRVDVELLQARLLGAAGLLPPELPRKLPVASEYLRRLWDAWWRERDALAGVTLPRAAWRFAGLRPANRPERRLALAAHWLVERDFAGRVRAWSSAPHADRALVPTLLAILEGGRDDFWSRHATLNSGPARKRPRPADAPGPALHAGPLAAPQPLLGAPRLTDLAVNVVLPWLWARAVAERDEPARAEAERRFHAWPAAEDNSVLKLARQRLLGGASASGFRTASTQQGLMQIVRDFCDQTDALCTGCRFPELVRALRPAVAGRDLF
ncbi:MAG: DUF2851 family protein [Verrucomicrobia bacterium]|nr:DUF2851 family protein [Verrucomicrobiota bacterium]